MSNEEWDDELIKDFFAEFNEAHNIVVETLMKMEHAPEDKELTNTVFRSIHSIKSLLRMIGMHEISSLVHHLENILDLVRHDEMYYDSLLSDLILALMDIVERCCEKAFSYQELDIDIKMVSRQIQEIIDTPVDDKSKAIIATLEKITKDKVNTPLEESLRDNQLLTGSSDSFDIKAFEAGLPTLADFTPRQRDLSFFRKLNRTLESKSIYEEGRGDRILIICSAINEAMGTVVSEEQLAAAVYIHDIGMGVLPPDVIGGGAAKGEEEKIVLFEHPIISKTLLDSFSGWEEASEIVYQHEEKCDGTGYPQGLKSDEICIGAKILMIVDYFEMKTHFGLPVGVALRRVMLDSIIEINNLTDTLFDKKVVSVFNKVIQILYRERKIFDSDEWH